MRARAPRIATSAESPAMGGANDDHVLSASADSLGSGLRLGASRPYRCGRGRSSARPVAASQVSRVIRGSGAILRPGRATSPTRKEHASRCRGSVSGSSGPSADATGKPTATTATVRPQKRNWITSASANSLSDPASRPVDCAGFRVAAVARNAESRNVLQAGWVRLFPRGHLVSRFDIGRETFLAAQLAYSGIFTSFLMSSSDFPSLTSLPTRSRRSA